MSEGNNMSKAEIEALVENLVSERVARIENDFEHKLKYLETSFSDRLEAMKKRISNLRKTLYGEVLLDPDDQNDTCLESRVSILESGEALEQFIAEDIKNDERLNERLRLMDERFDRLDFQLKISDDGGRIDTLESELAELAEAVKDLKK